MGDQLWKAVPVGDEFNYDPKGWLAKHANETMPWLLVHADDGVIWGKYKDDSLVLSGEVFDDPYEHPTLAVELRAVTIQQARLFGPGGELLVWRSRDGFEARKILDDNLDAENVIDEAYLLWHRPGERKKLIPVGDFTLLQEGEQGNRHAPPLKSVGNRRPCIHVRHYIDYDGQDQAYIALSRLVELDDGSIEGVEDGTETR